MNKMLATVIALFNVLALSATVCAKVTINAADVSAHCFSPPWQKQALIALKKDDFAFKGSASEHKKLAAQLLNCLASPDSKIRDGIAFEGLSQWFRANKFDSSFYNLMFDRLTAVIGATVNDRHGVYLPFSVLTLSELARVDRKAPFLTAKRRQQLVNIASDYLINVNDYRGFDNRVGWRHGVAHGADLMLQLALNPALTSLNSMFYSAHYPVKLYLTITTTISMANPSA